MALTIGRRLVLAVIAGSALTAAPPALAQPVEIPATFGGDFLSRPRLTGDWFGLRDEMGKRGVTLDKTGCAQRGGGVARDRAVHPRRGPDESRRARRRQ